MINSIFFNIYVGNWYVSKDIGLLVLEKPVMFLMIFDDTRYLRLNVRLRKESNNFLLTLTLDMDNR